MEPGDLKGKTVEGPLLIGIGHQTGVGKDTFAKKLKNRLERWGVCVSIVHFADHMKDMACVFFEEYGMANSAYYEDYPEEKDEQLPGCCYTPRDLWIRYANEMRKANAGVWVECMRRRLGWLTLNGVIIIPDVRFINEFDFIRSSGGILIDMSTDDADNDCLQLDGSCDASCDWDYIIYNDFKPKTLKKHAKILAKSIEGIL